MAQTMDKRDRRRPRTPEDLERQYGFFKMRKLLEWCEEKIKELEFKKSEKGEPGPATEFLEPATISLSGDITGSASSKKGWSINTSHVQKIIDDSFVDNFRQQVYGSTDSGHFLRTIRTNLADVAGAPQYGSGIGWGTHDTHGYLYVDFRNPGAYVGGGNAGKLLWYKQLAFSDHTHDGANILDGTITIEKLADSTIEAIKREVLFDMTYTKLEWLESDGACYINTGMSGNQNIGFEIEFTSLDKLSNSAYGAIFGARESSRKNEFHLTTYTGNASAGVFRLGSAQFDAKIKTNERVKHSYMNGVYTVNGTSETLNVSEFQTPGSIFLFALNNGGTATQYSKVRMRYMKLYKGSKLLRDFVPVKHNNSGELGMYDRVNDVFYTNKGSGKFIEPTYSIRFDQGTLHAPLETASYRATKVTNNSVTFDYYGDRGVEELVFPITGLNPLSKYTLSFAETYDGGFIEATYRYGCGIMQKSTYDTTVFPTDELIPSYVTWHTDSPGIQEGSITFMAESDTVYWVWALGRLPDRKNITITISAEIL